MNPLDLERGQILEGPNDSYVVEQIIGEGEFGVVYGCATQRWTASKYVALKLVKDPKNNRAAMAESAIMQVLKENQADQHHIVRCFSTFVVNKVMILEYELLDISLSQFLECNGRMTLMDIRPVIIQMATVMKFLKGLGLIHGDVKPENVVFENHAKGLKVKMIDFGSAHWSAAVTKGDFLGTLNYMAPEVVLGAHFNEAIDIWSLGCTVIEMLTGRRLFPVVNDIQLMSHIEQAMGSIPSSVLKKGVRTNTFYHEFVEKGKKVWTLKTKDSNHTKRPIKHLQDLSRIGHHYHSPSNDRKVDWEHFVDLTQRMFCLDPQTRITPEEVLEHPFISMSHLSTFSTNYVTVSAGLMHHVSSLPCYKAMLQPGEQQSTSAVTAPRVEPSTSRATVTAPQVVKQQVKPPPFGSSQVKAPQVETPWIEATPRLKSILVRRQKLSASSSRSMDPGVWSSAVKKKKQKAIRFADESTTTYQERKLDIQIQTRNLTLNEKRTGCGTSGHCTGGNCTPPNNTAVDAKTENKTTKMRGCGTSGHCTGGNCTPPNNTAADKKRKRKRESSETTEVQRKVKLRKLMNEKTFFPGVEQDSDNTSDESILTPERQDSSPISDLDSPSPSSLHERSQRSSSINPEAEARWEWLMNRFQSVPGERQDSCSWKTSSEEETSPIPEKQESSPVPTLVPIPDLGSLPGSSSLPLCDPEKLQRIMRRGKKGGMRRKTPADRPVDQESSNKSRVRRVQTKAKASLTPERQDSSPISDLDSPSPSSLHERSQRWEWLMNRFQSVPGERQDSCSWKTSSEEETRRKKLVKKTPHVPCVKQDSNSNTSGCEQETSPIPEKQESSPAPIPDLDCLPGSSSLPLCDPEKLQRIMRRGKKGGMRRKTPADRPMDQESSNKSRVRRVQTKAKASYWFIQDYRELGLEQQADVSLKSLFEQVRPTGEAVDSACGYFLQESLLVAHDDASHKSKLGRKKLVKKTPHVPCVKQDSNSNTSGCEQETSPIPEKQESSPAPIPDLDCLPGSSSLPLCDPEKLQRMMRRGKKGGMRRKTPADRPVDQESSNKSREKKLVKKTPHVPCVKQDSNSNTSGCEQETSPIPEKQESSPAPIPDLDCLPGSSSLPLCDPEKLQRMMRRGKKGGMRRKTPADRPVDQESSNKSRVRRVQTKAKARRKKLVKKTPHVPCVKQDSNSNTSGCEQETSPIPEKQESSPAPIPDLDCLPGSSSLPLCDPEKLQRRKNLEKKTHLIDLVSFSPISEKQGSSPILTLVSIPVPSPTSVREAETCRQRETILSSRKVPIRRNTTPECRNILRRCLVKDPKSRISLRDLKNHLWLRD
uniref:Protein kinase domain-containing protein n=1 Tax=Knipowitschia caucasica TaxID=637954 RepID=A0AAV2LP98_KNICA